MKHVNGSTESPVITSVNVVECQIDPAEEFSNRLSPRNADILVEQDSDLKKPKDDALPFPRLPLPPGIDTRKESPDGKLPDKGTPAFDRRNSLPLIGIDLGRSGPSYGRTLKRSSLAIYGRANPLLNHQPIARRMRVEKPVMNQEPGRSSASACIGPNRNSRVAFAEVDENAPRLKELGSSQGVSIAARGINKLKSQRRPSLSLSRSQSCRSPNVTSLRLQRNLKARGERVLLKREGIEMDNQEVPRAESYSGPDSSSTQHHSRLPSLENRDEENKNDSRQPVEDPGLRSNRIKKKKQVIKELIETEKRYLELLNKINTNYLIPIHQSQSSDKDSKPILARKTTADIFSNFTAILGLSRHFLKTLESLAERAQLFELDFNSEGPLSLAPSPMSEDAGQRPTENIQLRTEKKYERDSEGISIGATLLNLLPFFKLYTTFTSNFAISQSTLHVHSETRGPSPLFSKLLGDCRRRGVDGGLGLSHMLLGVIQRVPRYELMIKDLVKYSSTQNDSDYNDLLAAKNMVGSVARRLEFGMRQQEETKIILQIQRSMEGLSFPLVIPSRRLIKMGTLKKIGRKGDLQDRVFFLFNDCLLYAGILKNLSAEAIEVWLNSLGLKTHSSPSDSASLDSTKSSLPGLFATLGYSEESASRLIFCRKIELRDVTVVGAVHGPTSTDGPGSFQIISSAKSFVVYANDPIQGQHWITTLRVSKNDFLDGRRTLFLNEDQNSSCSYKSPSTLRHSLGNSSFRGVSWFSVASSDEGHSTGTQFDSLSGASSASTSKSGGATAATGSSQHTVKSINEYRTTPHCSEGVPRHDPTSFASSPSSFFNWTYFVRKSLSLNGTTGLSAELANHTLSSVEDFLPLSRSNSEPRRAFPGPATGLEQTDAMHNEPSGPPCERFVADNYCAPIWVPDNKVRWCMGGCQSRFGILKRRHHCRLCGGVFCARCSSKTFVIANQDEGDQLARTCEACFKSVFIDPQNSIPTEAGKKSASYLPILSNRLHDDLELAMTETTRRHSYMKHQHRRSLPKDLGSDHFRHSLAHLREQHTRTSIISATSAGQESMSVISEDYPSASPLEDLVVSQFQNITLSQIDESSSVPITARKRLAGLLQQRMQQR